MSFLDKAKELSNRVAEKTVEFSSDEMIADTIMKAVDKQEKVNAILKARGSNYRVSSLDLANGHTAQRFFWYSSRTGVRRG